MSSCEPSSLAPGLMLGADVQLGQRLHIGAHVVIHDSVIVGDECTIQDGAVLGKPPQLGARTRAPKPPSEPLVIKRRATICCHAVICSGARIGPETVIGDHAFLREGATIGAETVIGQGSAIGRGVHIGNRVRLQNNVIIAPESFIEDDVFFGPLVVATNDPTIGRRQATGTPLQGVIARRGCRVGASAILMPGIEIGIEAVIAAGAIVTHSVPNHTIVIGAPAQPVGKVDPKELLDERHNLQSDEPT